MSTVLGIDFGTTNSVVSVISGMSPEVLEIDKVIDDRLEWARHGFDAIFPSLAAQDHDGSISFGWMAKFASSGRFEAVKRMFATQQDVATDDAGHSLKVDEVATMLFAEMKRRAAGLGYPANRAVVTVPANSKGVARHRTKSCAGMAGLEVLALINEPTAAAMAYAHRNPECRQLLVFDWGGGTLDVTVLQHADGVFIEQASNGIARSGGIDFDSKLRRLVFERRPDLRNLDAAARNALNLEIEVTKVILSQATSRSMQLPDGTELDVSRRDFEQEIAPLLEAAKEPLERAMRETGIARGTLDALVLVGGTCKIPAVQAMVESVVGVAADTGEVNPMTAVAEGAAIAGGILAGTLPNLDFFVCLEHSLGTWVLDRATQDQKFSTIIRKGTKLPASNVDTFFPVHEDQESVLIEIVEGDPDATDPDFTTHKEWSVPLLESYPPDSDRGFLLEYSYDVDGIVHVTATDKDSGEELLRGEVAYSTATDKREMKKMSDRVAEVVKSGRVTEASAVRVDDPEVAALIEKATNKVMPFLEDDEKEPIVAAVAALRAATGADVARRKRELADLLAPHSYLF